LTSKRRTADQGPATPVAEFARTLHHILVAGKLAVEKCETVTV
jgi:hypothetical protein